jgi:5-methylcytosine-specific restriction enzyme subunit McrC
MPNYFPGTKIRGSRLQIFEAVERQQISIPTSNFVGNEGGLSFLPQIREKGYFDVDFRGNELVLVAGNYIGQIPLTSDIAINVKPKFPIANLARIVGLANQPIRCLDYFRRTYALEKNVSRTLLEAIAQSLLSGLEEVEREGLLRAYTPISERITGLRGRLDSAAYVRSMLARGLVSKIACTYFVFSTDTIHNRIVKRAIHKLGEDLSSLRCSDPSIPKRLAHFADYFERVKLDDDPDLVASARLFLESHRIPELRSYYLNVLDVCFVVLGGTGVHLIESFGPNSLHSFIVNLEDAFEQYIRRLLQDSPALRAKGVPVLDGNTEGSSKLFVDNSKFIAKPDLVVGGLEAARAVGDVKYKPKLAESDRYQLIAHALAYGVKRSFIVTPAIDGAKSGATYVGRIGTNEGIEVYRYSLDLESPDIVTDEANFQSWVEKLVA